MSPPILRVEGLRKVIRKRTLVNSVSFVINEGELFGLLGPNGAGKTTILRMIVGLIRPTAGSIWVNGQRLKENFSQAMQQIGCIIETPPPLYHFLTGWENLLLVRNMLPTIPPERIAVVGELMQLTARLSDKVRTYSLGMKQRLGIAQALLHQPRLLILDEPTNGLDPSGIQELREFLHHLTRKEEVSVLLSTHLLHEAEKLCDRVLFLSQGKPCYVGPAIPSVPPEQQTVPVEWVVHPIEKAHAWLLACPQVQRIQIMENNAFPLPQIRTYLHGPYSFVQKTISYLNQQLNAQGIRIQGIHVQQPRLEDHFLAKTKQTNTVREEGGVEDSCPL